MKKTHRDIFNEIYKYRKWIFGSGTSSIAFLNKPFINFVNTFLASHHHIRTVVDLGCGDFQIGKHFALGGRVYIGCDVSSYIIERNKRRYEKDNIYFLELNAVEDPLPAGDVVIIKDVLMHLSNDDIHRILAKMHAYKYIIIQNCIGALLPENTSIQTGRWWRPLDITRPPFNYCTVSLAYRYYEGLYWIPFTLMHMVGLPVLYNGIFTNDRV